MTESEQIAFLIAGRADLTEGQRRFLRTMGSAERVRSTLAELDARSDERATVHAGTLAPYLRSGAQAPAARAEQQRVMATRFGRRDMNMPHWDGNEYVLPQITPAQARAILQRHAKEYGSDPGVPMRAGGGVDVAYMSEIAATAAARGKVRGE